MLRRDADSLPLLRIQLDAIFGLARRDMALDLVRWKQRLTSSGQPVSKGLGDLALHHESAHGLQPMFGLNYMPVLEPLG